MLVSATIRTGTAFGPYGVDLRLDLVLAHGWPIQGIQPGECIAQSLSRLGA